MRRVAGERAVDQVDQADRQRRSQPPEIGGIALCSEPATCHISGHAGRLYNVYEDDAPEPLDWQGTVCPTRWRFGTGVATYDWMGDSGVEPPR